MLTEHIDLALVALYAFWLFFAGLLFYLRREDRREGYPLELDQRGTFKNHGVIWIPEPKTFNLAGGRTAQAPNRKADLRSISGNPIEPWPGAPLEPAGDNLMLSGVGPAAYAERADVPDLTHTGEPKIRPLRALKEFHVAERDVDPRGYPVVAVDGAIAGKIVDLWVDRSEYLIRYMEVELSSAASGNGGDAAGRHVLLPMPLARIDGRNERVEVTCLKAEQFAAAPVNRSPDEITLLEEERVSAYFASGYLYSSPQNREPLL
ncbi:MAG: photosynthetic reaction center subunit H [Rhizobiales bacterium]|nr:photosynthetic reaction center subunit H [Hyphomicrobiales bacterium]